MSCGQKHRKCRRPGMWSAASIRASPGLSATSGCGSWSTAMARARRTRLARMTAQAGHADSAEASERAAVGAWAAVCTLVREKLTQKGIDPEQVGALRLAPPPIPLPEGDSQDEFVLADGDGLASVF